MCYGEPELKSEDTVWEKESDGYDPEIEKLKYAKDGDDTKREVLLHHWPPAIVGEPDVDTFQSQSPSVRACEFHEGAGNAPNC